MSTAQTGAIATALLAVAGAQTPWAALMVSCWSTATVGWLVVALVGEIGRERASEGHRPPDRRGRMMNRA